MSNTVKLAKELFIVYNGQAIAKATSYTFNLNKSEIDISSLDSDGWAEKLADQKDWNFDFDGMVTRGIVTGTSYSEMTGTTHMDFNALLEQIKTNDEPVEVALSSRVSGDTYQSGMALLTSLSESGSVGAAVTYSGTLAGTGTLTTKTSSGETA